MDAIRNFLMHHGTDLAVPLCVLVATLAAGFAVKRLVLRALRNWIDQTRSQTALRVMQALRGPFMIWVLMLGMHLAVQSSDLPERATLWVTRLLAVLWIVSLTIIGSGLAGNLIRFYGNGASGALPVTTLTKNLAQLGVYILGLLVLLNQLGISITPILTALGVGGLAVALALQDTLSNLFAGFYIAVAGQIRIGDYIKLNTGEEGYVTDITWRSTCIRALANNMIIVPNGKLAQAIVVNYHLPEKRIAVSIGVSVSYDSDIDKVERVLLELAGKATTDLPAMLAEPAPVFRFQPGFGESALNLTLVCHVAEFADQFVVQHELRKRILRRFREERIEMPYPTRTLYIKTGSEAEAPEPGR